MDSATARDNIRSYLANRSKFPLDQLATFAGQFVAWSPDGTRIVAHAAEAEALDDLVRAQGEDPGQCVVEWIGEEVNPLGGLKNP